MKLSSSHIASIFDISLIAFFYIALLLFVIGQEDLFLNLLFTALLFSAISVVLYTVYGITTVLKHNKTNLLFWIAHIVNVVWLVTNIIGLKSIKVMGSPLF